MIFVRRFGWRLHPLAVDLVDGFCGRHLRDILQDDFHNIWLDCKNSHAGKHQERLMSDFLRLGQCEFGFLDTYYIIQKMHRGHLK